MSTDPTERNVLPKFFNILSLDGGGARGVIQAIILQRLLKGYPKLLRDTDMLVGTSVGGIQALALAADTPVDQMISFFKGSLDDVFKDSIWDDIKDVGRLNGAEYSTDNLRRLLTELFGDKKLLDLSKKVAIPAFDLDNNLKDPMKRRWKPKVFHNFPNSDTDEEMKVVDVALYTSAAPTYFPAVDGYIDGGVFANNPSLIAIAQAIDKRGPHRKLEEVKLLSIGTGLINHYEEGGDLDWGLRQWGLKLIDLVFDSMVGVTDFQCSLLLGPRYTRVQPNLPADKDFKLDDWKEVDELIEIAKKVDLSNTIGWLEAWWK